MLSENQECRLCCGSASPTFEKLVLGRFPVTYLRCAQCQSLQTESPYWLPEAYSPVAPAIDLRAIARAMAVRSLIHQVLDLLSMPRTGTLLDWGAGNGILVRLLRDKGTDAHCLDRYVRPLYAEDREPPANFDVITAFEVWEHFPEPNAEIDRIFAYRPAVLMVSTEFYRDQTEEWTYLHPDIGRHVFFYSEQAMNFLGRRYGYDVVCGSRFSVFAREAIETSTRRVLRENLENPVPGLPAR